MESSEILFLILRRNNIQSDLKIQEPPALFAGRPGTSRFEQQENECLLERNRRTGSSKA
jgi:hypothetical protein